MDGEESIGHRFGQIDLFAPACQPPWGLFSPMGREDGLSSAIIRPPDDCLSEFRYLSASANSSASLAPPLGYRLHWATTIPSINLETVHFEPGFDVPYLITVHDASSDGRPSCDTHKMKVLESSNVLGAANQISPSDTSEVYLDHSYAVGFIHVQVDGVFPSVPLYYSVSSVLSPAKGGFNSPMARGGVGERRVANVLFVAFSDGPGQARAQHSTAGQSRVAGQEGRSAGAARGQGGGALWEIHHSTANGSLVMPSRRVP
ncbi:hypothetical protein AXG93_1217s1420 [Marchantia polymorpha subsp. ruderalis]|uniref:Uncharacterized protein n=1 Tax=Marchantia polymorpha subsp. ruderalis TaxID=1480154 RepID=A0A176VSZ3_MARPO|nr:hypothetical protein AXG93_1217s1420 [Marchantia polymorpha subsp. ruderalis]